MHSVHVTCNTKMWLTTLLTKGTKSSIMW